MPSVGVGLGIGGLIMSNRNSKAQSEAIKGASEAQLEASKLGIEEQRRQFDTIQKLLEPYTVVGKEAVEQQARAAGLRGTEAQQEYIRGVEESPIFESLTRQGEEAILSRASATGGLRGGDVQGVLAQFRPNLLNQLLRDEYSKLGGLTSTGQAAAAGTAAAASRTGTNVTNLITQGGQATAGGILAQGQIKAQQYGDIAKTIGIATGGF